MNDEQSEMTIIEEMISAVINKINHRNEKLRLIQNNLPNMHEKQRQAMKIVVGTGLRSNKMALEDIKNLQEDVKKLARYKGPEKNYLIMNPREAAGLYYRKQREKNDVSNLQLQDKEDGQTEMEDISRSVEECQ